MRRVLIANRGEIAVRIARVCRRLGLETVAVHSSADAASPHIWAADQAVEIGPPAARDSYLNVPALLEVARHTGCDAVHPGYGFLSETPAFARAVTEAGCIFVGPPADAIAAMGDKASARQLAEQAGVPVVPGSPGAFTDAGAAAAVAQGIGFPLLVKARSGGGGRGMRLAETAAELQRLLPQAVAEADAAFGDGSVYLERYFRRIRHIEVQMFADTHGRSAHVWDRDCSLQRRHQKLVEEAPSPALPEATRDAMCAAALRLAEQVSYVNAGTVEFLYEADGDHFYFIEMNTRIQVEHPVSEAITGLDLIAEQMRVADGQPLSFPGGPPAIDGHAVEFRVNAERPGSSFQPNPGRLTAWRPPQGPHLRCDGIGYKDYEVTPFYDSLLAKLIVHGTNREAALVRAADAIEAFEVDGVETTLPFYRALVRDAALRAGDIDTGWIERSFLPRLFATEGGPPG